MARLKRVRLKQWDLFTIPVPGLGVGYGQIVEKAGNIRIIVFRDLNRSPPDVARAEQAGILLLGWTMDALFAHDRWHITGNLPRPPTFILPRPFYKLGLGGDMRITDSDGQPLRPATAEEADMLDYRWSRSPICFQHWLAAEHGAGPFPNDAEQITYAYALKQQAIADRIRATL